MFLLLVTQSLAATLTVGSSGTYSSIQSAINAATSGDTLTVAAGTYRECLDLRGRDLVITGVGSGSATIDGSTCAGDAIEIDQGETATISGFTIENGSDQAINIDAGAVVSFDDIIVENSGSTSTSGAFADGGAMSIAGASYVEITDSIFDDNTADYGGAIYVEASWLVLSSVEFSGNYASYGGGAVRAESAAEIEMTSCTFSHNGTSYSSGKGGALSLYASILEDDGSTLEENYSATYGGAISAEASSELTLSGSVLEGNYVDNRFSSPISGGAIYAESMEVFEIDGAEFIDNVVYLYGGAIHCNGMNTGSTFTITDTLFSGNETQSKRGGAVEVSAGVDLIVTDSVFDGNTSAEAGAALSIYTLANSQDAIITGSTFTDNETTSTRDAHGGAVFVYSQSASVSIEIDDCEFDGNTASLSGGGLYTSGIEDIIVSNTSFTDNLASNISTTSLGNYNGGAMSFFEADTVTLSALTVCNNIGDDGGAIYMETVAELSMTNSLIIDNTANVDGGNVHLYDTAGEIINNNLLGGDATVGGGIYLDSGSAIDFINNVVAYTVAGRGAVAGDSSSASSSSFIYNDWYDNTASDTGGSFSFSTTSSGNITSAPGFTAYSSDGNCGNDDFIPTSSSALIDAGDTSIYDADGSRSDIGAFGGPGSSLVDADGDGYYSSVDCDDDDSSVNPGATEVCDGIDNDCDDTIDEGASDAETWFADDDGDGFGDADDSTEACEQPSGYVADDTDCDDSDSSANPDEAEVCDGVDNDCDGDVDEGTTDSATTWYSDVDGDGYGSTFDTEVSCTQPAGYVDNVDDCDDSDASINPDADEYCDGDDNDCDGDVDEDDAVDGATWYADLDGDGYGIPTFTTTACTQPTSYAATSDDCDDGDSSINPGADEICDGDDNDCDTYTDEDDAVDATIYYADDDGDGFGDSASSQGSCSTLSGYVTDDQDCDDSDASINPDADEYCDGDDNDCDGVTDEDDALDVATFYADTDGDGYGDVSSTTEACSAPSGFVTDSDDCDDGDSAQHPGADEYCNAEDDDCDGVTDEDSAVDAVTFYRDADGDGYGDIGSTTAACQVPSGYVADSDDCDDGDSAQHPGADEYCNDEDDNCDGTVDEDSAVDASTFYRDADGDGYGDPAVSTLTCASDTSYVADNTDCDDGRSTVNPGADEYCDAIDNDCDEEIDNDAVDAAAWYADADGDGFGDAGTVSYACDQPSGEVGDDSDCDDSEALANPEQEEIPYDGIDNDCDGADLTDVDGDGFDAIEAGGDDCDDTDSSIHPDASEVDGDGVDQNCDGADGGAIDTGEGGGKNGCSTVSASSAGLWALVAVFGALSRRRRQPSA